MRRTAALLAALAVCVCVAWMARSPLDALVAEDGFAAVECFRCGPDSAVRAEFDRLTQVPAAKLRREECPETAPAPFPACADAPGPVDLREAFTALPRSGSGGGGVNIVILVMDSVSRCDFVEFCPALAAALDDPERTFDAVRLGRLHTVHELGTRFQLTPLLAGESGVRLPGADAPFLWREARAAGYWTVAMTGWLYRWRGKGRDALWRQFDALGRHVEPEFPDQFLRRPACRDGQYPPQQRIRELRRLIRASEHPVFALEHGMYAHETRAFAGVFDASYAAELPALLSDPSEPTVVLLMGDHGKQHTAPGHNWPFGAVLATRGLLPPAALPADPTAYDLRAMLLGVLRGKPVAAERHSLGAHALVDLPGSPASASALTQYAFARLNADLERWPHCPQLSPGRVRSAVRYGKRPSLLRVEVEVARSGGFVYELRALSRTPSAPVEVVDVWAVSTFHANFACTEEGADVCLCSLETHGT